MQTWRQLSDDEGLLPSTSIAIHYSLNTKPLTAAV